jgi:predicted ArsR family transcriptional regulator
MSGQERQRQIGAVAALGGRARGALYDYVAAQREPVSRDQAAQAVGIGRPLAAFHLDRLVQEGLLEASYRRLGDRSGPGAGRPSKLYRRAATEVSVSLPPRDYALVARLLARAVAAGDGSREALDRAAGDMGLAMGREVRELCGPSAGGARLREAALGILEDRGYEPFAGDGAVRLRNCPFHSLAAEHPELVCGMNLALIGGLVRGIGTEVGVEARLEPAPELCCVALRDRASG